MSNKTAKTAKTDLQTEIALLSPETAEQAKADKWTIADLEAWLELFDYGFWTKSKGRNMARTLDKYRDKYQRCVAYSGKASLNNGDAVAQLLKNASPQEACETADRLLGLEVGTLFAKYRHLNPGQIRMNASNKIRGAIKRGELVLEG